MTPLIRSAGGVTLIGGGAVSAQDLAEALARAPLLVAADGGADAALALDAVPEAAIGDFDSISDQARAAIGAAGLHHIAEQDSTDFAKCLTRIAAPFVIAVGFSGRRLDHTLAALNVMTRHPAPPCIMIAAEDIAFIAPPQLNLPLAAGCRLSLIPMGPVRGRSTGLRWPIDGIEFAPDGRSGSSNQTTGPVTLTLEGPMLVLLPREALDLALAALVPTAAIAPDPQ